MSKTQIHRRSFLAAASLASSAALLPQAMARNKSRHKVERLGIGAIGLRYQGTVIAEKAQIYGDIVALADVDQQILEKGRSDFGNKTQIFSDYRELLERPDVDVVTIGTPDHWHIKMAIDACRAGKDVYVEKPLSLTIDEGKRLREVVRQTGRVVQVGSWQRSDHRFRLAVEMVRQGRLGDLQRVDVVLGKNKTGGPFPFRQPPTHLNWDLWQGQTPNVSYQEERCHYKFRWWQAYSGGQMTDWGAHHLDIAQWAINAWPEEIEGQANYPAEPDGYDVPVDFSVDYRYPNGVLMTVRDTGRNGILLTGTRGRIFVNRGTLQGKPVEQLAEKPLQREQFQEYAYDNLERPQRAGKLDAIMNHMGNFFDCVDARKQPISDVESQHRSVSTCHLGNISMKLARPLKWDATQERFQNDPEANALLVREQRKGFEVV
ncbi:MAG: Gfo/Idh/MocA family oxidoreductase [Pirellulaceae bacterium]|nr:Gfo/Idh/MocA family oxidoreductase [Pirellulaceae bacterium]